MDEIGRFIYGMILNVYSFLFRLLFTGRKLYPTHRTYRNYTMGSSYGSGLDVIGGSVDVLKTSSAVNMMTSSLVFSYLSFIIKQPPYYAKKALAA